MASGGAFHRAYTHATQQAFLEAHELAFAYFGGVFHRLRSDNLPLAVKRILRGRERAQTARFIAFRSHWRFASEFCTPGKGHEKGGIEGEAGLSFPKIRTPVSNGSFAQSVPRGRLDRAIPENASPAGPHAARRASG